MWFQRNDNKKEEAQAALDESRKKLKEVRDRGAEVTAVSNAFRDFREKNHIAAQLEEIILRRGGSLT